MSLLSGLSNTILWPLLSRADTAFGWGSTVMIGVGAITLIYIPLVFRFSVPPGGGDKDANTPSGGEPEHIDTARFVLVAGSTALNGFITWGFSLPVIPLLTQKGIDQDRAVRLASMLGVVSIAARAADVVGGWSSLQAAVASTATMLVAFMLLYFGSFLVVATSFFFLYGMAGGVMSVARATLPLSLFPATTYARAASRLAMPLNLSFAIAPPVFPRLLER